MCHPPNAKRPAIEAWTIAVQEMVETSTATAAAGAAAGESPGASARPTAIINPIAATLPTVNAVCSRLPCSMPR